MTRRGFLIAGAAAAAAGAATARMGVAKDSYTVARPKDALEFLEHMHRLGAAGVQVGIGSTDPQRLRARAEELGMYVEAAVSLPKSGNFEAFERDMAAAKAAGARCVRSVCLSGRRYELMHSREDWVRFVATSEAAVTQALRVAERLRMPVALENHKDRTADEMAAFLKARSSEWLGVCLDTGNNLALLDDPMYVVETLAPFAISTHIKDMAVDRYAEGFLLSEVPLGQGLLDIRRIMETIRAKGRRGVAFNIEMITRDPLKIPCLTDDYWSTFQERGGVHLARTLRMVEAKRKSLPQVSGMGREEVVRLEEENVRRCLAWV